MNELIKLTPQTLNDTEVNTVNARELHEFLESRQDFSTWIKKRIKNYNFVENQDFMLLHKKMEQVSGSKHLIEYYISLDMAKELSMVERNERGKQARRYFIECEKQLQQTLKPMSEMEMIHVMSGEVIKIQNRLEQVEQKVEELSDISEFYDRLMSDEGLYTSTQMGSLFNLSAKAFNDKLKEHKIAYKTTQEGRTYMVFYSQYKDSNLGQVVLWNRRNGSFGSCLKFRLNIIPLLEKKFDMKANPDVLKQFLYQRIKDGI